MQQIFQQAALNPRKLFLIDCLGALLSAVLYGAVLAQFEDTFGMPPKVLYTLSILAGVYAIFSGSCYLANLKKWEPFLRIIALANLLHCCLTIGLVVAYYQEITSLGLLYFAGELVIVTSLAIVELKTASSN